MTFLRQSSLFTVIALLSATAALAQPQPAWSPVGSGSQALAYPTRSYMAPSGNIYVLQTPPGSFFNLEIARWDGTQWMTLPGAVPYLATSIAVTDAEDAVYVGIRFLANAIDGNGTVVPINGIGRYDISLQTWSDLDGGVEKSVYDLAIDGSGNLFVVGDFEKTMNGAVLNRAARWNQSAGVWEQLGGGLSGTATRLAIDPSHTTLVATGLFDTAFDLPNGTPKVVNQVAQFDLVNNVWSPLGNGFDVNGGSSVSGLETDGTNVYAAGLIRLGGLSRPVFKWNGSSWGVHAELGDVAVAPSDLQLDGSGTLYVIGSTSSNVFTPGSLLHARAANATTWTQIARNVPVSAFRTIAASQASAAPDVFLGGGFSDLELSNGSFANAYNFARWNGSSWANYQPPFIGVAGTVSATEELLLVPPTQGSGFSRVMAVGGDFINIAGKDLNRVAVFDGTTWDKLGFGVTDQNGIVRTILQPPPTMFSGQFDVPIPVPFIIGGSFTEVTNPDSTNVAVGNIAEWRFDSQTWLGLGQGVSKGGVAGTGTVYATSISSGCPNPFAPGYVYVGGDFDMATNADGSSIAVSNLARYNLTSEQWEPVEGGTNGPVFALETFKGRLLGSANPQTDGLWDHILVVGGAFAAALDQNGTSVSGTENIAWLADTGDWLPMGNGTGGPVLAVDGIVPRRGPDRLCRVEIADFSVYVGGQFTSVKSVGPQIPASNLARWSRVFGWEEMGQPFGQASGTPGNGVNGAVRSVKIVPLLSMRQGPLTVTTVEIGGDFSEAYDENGNTIASGNVVRLRDYDEWPYTRGFELFEPVGTGTDGLGVNAVAWTTCLQFSGYRTDTRYVGGRFATVGNGLTSAGLAKHRGYLPPFPPRITSATTSSTGGGGGTGGAQRGYATVPFEFTCRHPSLGKTTGGLRSNELDSGQLTNIELGTVSFGETIVLPDAHLPIGVQTEIRFENDLGTTISRDTVLIDAIDAPFDFVLSGVDDPGQFAANPDGISTKLSVQAIQVAGREQLPDGQGLVQFMNAVTDAPRLSVRLSDGTAVVDSLQFNQLAVALQLPLGSTTVTIHRTDDDSQLGTFTVDVTAAENVQIAVLSGFLDPSANNDGPPLTLIPISVSDDTSVGVDKIGVRDLLGSDDFEFSQGYPNPFQAETDFVYESSKALDVNIAVFDLLGRRVAVLGDGALSAGMHTIHWDATDQSGGVYLVRVQSGETVRVRKVIKGN